MSGKVVKDSVDSYMNELERIVASGKPINLDDAREHAEYISVLLLVFPYLFPPATNQWTPGDVRDAAADTYAAPELWTSLRTYMRWRARLPISPSSEPRGVEWHVIE